MAAAARKVNWFAIWVSVAVVVVLVVVGGPGREAQQLSATAPGRGAAGGEHRLRDRRDHRSATARTRSTTYIDFMCPVCNQFEQIYGPTIQGLVDDGTITLGIHPIAILDRASQGTEYSTRAANAMYCVAVADAEAASPSCRRCTRTSPRRATPGLTDEEILAIASGVGVDGIDDCVNDGKYSEYVTAMTEKTPVQPGAGGIGTPTIVVNGEVLDADRRPAGRPASTRLQG